MEEVGVVKSRYEGTRDAYDASSNISQVSSSVSVIDSESSLQTAAGGGMTAIRILGSSSSSSLLANADLTSTIDNATSHAVIAINSAPTHRDARPAGGIYDDLVPECQLRSSLFDLDSIAAQKTRMTIFGSSTFTDTKVERRVLTSNILPKLQEKGRRYGILITMFDMRYGVKDDNLKNHLIWETCRDEIQRCYEESSGSFFLSMQGDKYGFRTIPRVICQADFEWRLASWSDVSLKDLANEWYKLDYNCVPPSYVLRPLEDYNDKRYWDNYWKLRDGFEGLVFEKEYPDIVVGSSITEWETRYALGKSGSVSRRRSFWIRRSFDESITKDVDPYHHFIENIDRSSRSHDLCNGLKAYLETTLPNEDIFNLKCRSLSDLCNIREVVPISKDLPYGDYIFDCPTPKGIEYLEAWERSVHVRLDKELDKLVEEVEVWNSADRNGYGITGDDLNEMLHHHKFAKTKACSYYGREDLLDRCMHMLGTRDNSKSTGELACVCLGIVGVTGSGKTTLMSKLSVDCRSRFSLSTTAVNYEDAIPVIIRFCGTSVQSTDGLSLIRSISIELMQHYKSQAKGPFPLSSSYKEVLPFFHDLLSKYPVILLIDSLDQLSDAYEERSRLSFLTGIRLHEKSRIVVSCLPDDTKYKYLCEQRLKEAGTPRVDVGLLDVFDTREAKHILSRILSDRYSRVISKEDQFLLALASVSVESSTLYLNLAARIISTWRSFDDAESVSFSKLEPTVAGIVNQIFSSLSKTYGEKLVRHAIFFITYSVAGVNDNEIQDLLTMSDKVMEEVKSGERLPSISRFPTTVFPFMCGVVYVSH